LNTSEYYAGSTADVKKRLLAHKSGKNTSTKNKRPVKLVWCGMFKTKKLAQDFEEYLKSSSGSAFRNKHLL
jgi:predicted GIY-YIG superfamily endonuclease